MINPIPEYDARLQENGIVNWQHRMSEYFNHDVYKRPYPNLWELQVDLTDKFGARFAKRVVRDLQVSKSSTNRATKSR